MLASRSRGRLGTLLGAAILAALLVVVPAPVGLAHVCVPDPVLPAGLSGTLLVPRDSGLAQIDLPERTISPLVVLPSSGVVNALARAADGSRLALSRFSRPPGDPIGGSDLLVTGALGGEAQVLVQRDRPGELLGNPIWLPDRGLLFERQSLGSQVADSRLERVDANGGNRQLVVQQAAFPALAPDGELLVFVRSAGTDRLIARPLAGGAEQIVVDDPRFLALAFPRFSPDGAWLAFAATGGEIAAKPGSVASLLQPGPRAARAHGLPWDVWLVRPDGTELRRLTSFYDDDASVAWSPDGRWLVVYAGEATQAVAIDGSASSCLFGSGGFGVVEWF